jgi:formylmethanofuran dehydrogenase subunit D
MRVRACLVKTAQYKARAEEGKFSEAYNREATAVLVHPEDIASWGFRDGIHVSCSNQETTEAVILVVRPTRNAKKGMVNIIISPWTACLVQDDRRIIDVDLEPSSSSTLTFEEILKGKRLNST